MLSRRTFVGRLAAGAAVACATGVGVAEAKNRLSGSASGSAPSTPSELGASLTAASSRGSVAVDQLGPTADAPQAAPAPQAPPPWELVRPLAEGVEVGHGWRVAGLTGAVNGSCVLTLRNARGREHRVHLCRNDGRPQGLVYTERVDLVVMNGGAGELPTEEGLAQAVAAVAHALAANESGHAEVVTALLPQAERVQRFAGAAGLR